MKYKKDALGTRMKEYYENIPKTKLMRRCPVMLRLDGVAFHTFTRGLKRPFDDILRNSMNDTMLYLCSKIQGCVFGYTQSDEISLLLIDYKNLDSSAWFDYEVEKICSVASGMATLAFNKAFEKHVEEYISRVKWPVDEETNTYIKTLRRKVRQGGFFDTRCFNIPKEEVCNMFYWRQLDARRNSISMVAQSIFSSKELHKKTSSDKKEMLLEKGIDWDAYAPSYKWGTSCFKKCVENSNKTMWFLDTNMPLLKNTEDTDYRFYVEKYVFVGE